MIWHVLDCTHVGLEYWGVHIWGHWHDDVDVVGDRLRFELSLGLDEVLNLATSEVFNDTVSPDEWFHMRVNSVRHQVELTIWRDEANAPLAFEFVQSHTLMELDILHLNEFTSRSTTLLFKKFLVI